MSLDEFIEALKATPRTWRIVANGRPSIRQGWLWRRCPLTAVARANGISCGVDEYDRAGKSLRLSSADRLAISIASDGPHPDYPPGWFDPALRARLLDACGLAP